MEDSNKVSDILEDDILLKAHTFDWKMYSRDIGYNVASFAKIYSLVYCFLIPLLINVLSTYKISMSIICNVIFSSNLQTKRKCNGLSTIKDKLLVSFIKTNVINQLNANLGRLTFLGNY